jgi:hypothetical protein
VIIITWRDVKTELLEDQRTVIDDIEKFESENNLNDSSLLKFELPYKPLGVFVMSEGEVVLCPDPVVGTVR